MRGTTTLDSVAILLSSLTLACLLLRSTTLTVDSFQIHCNAGRTVVRYRLSRLHARRGDGNTVDQDRRIFVTSSTAAAVLAFSSTPMLPAVAVSPSAEETLGSVSGLTWPLGKVAYSLLPLAGTYTPRITVQECILPDVMWTHDQILGILNVNVPIRQTVVKLSQGGGLLVYNPIAPTRQLMRMMNQLVEEHGPVRHLILGTVALEHKATFGPFADRFPNATAWLQPGQWAFPLNLPIEFTGLNQRGPRLREIPSSKLSPKYSYYNTRDPIPEWTSDFEYEVLGPLFFKSTGGSFSETVLYHKVSRTLLVTDTVVSVTEDPPRIIQEDPRAMLFHSRDSIHDVVMDNDESRKRGWRRMVQFGLIFFPSQIEVVLPVSKAIREARDIDKEMKPLGEGAVPFSLYPWFWHENDADIENFNAISRNGALFCPPILLKLILDREPERTLEWVGRVCTRFHFRRVISSHLNNNVMATPEEFRAAFNVLSSNDPNNVRKRKSQQRPLAEDLALLQKASDLLTRTGVIAASKVYDVE